MSGQLRPEDPGFGRLFAQLDQPLLVLERDTHRILLVNAAAERRLGYGPGMLLDALLVAPLAPTRDDADAPIATRLRTREGLCLDVEISLSPVQEGIVLAAVRDVTDRRHVEEQLRDHAALLDLVPDAIFVRDFATGQISYWNRAAETLYGWSQGEALGKRASVLLQTQLPRPREVVERELAETGHWQGEVEHFTRDQRRLSIATRWAIRYDLDGHPRDVLAINNDLTQRKHDASELARLAATTAALRERDQLLATVSHDLKTPLTAIRGQADLMLRALDREGALEPDRARKGLELLRTAAMRMATWIDDLLDTARLEAGRGVELHREPTDLIDMTWQAVLEHQRNAERHQLRIETAESRIIGVWDPIRLRRVLDNLLSNAIKYSPEGGEILVTISVSAIGDAVLRVRDRGVGIPASELPHSFERYRRAANVVGRFSGSGIGLSGVCQIVQEHGGQIEVESHESRGTTFTVTLPLVPRSVAA